MTQSPSSDDRSSLPADWVAGHVLSQADIELLRDKLAAHVDESRTHRTVTASLRRRMAAGLGWILSKIGNLASALEPPMWLTASTGGFVLVALVLSLPLIWNPGYFSHDELQWLAFADKPSLADIHWSAWFDFSPFQYRPLTFNLWLLLSHWFGYQPIVMHLLRILLGVAGAALLRAVLLFFGTAPRRAAMACWFFLLTPYAIYTDAWIGTIADSLCLVFLLLALRHVLVQPATASWWQAIARALPVAALTLLALMSKESAVVFPAVVVIGALRRRDRTLATASVVSTCIVLLYLALRVETILFTHDVSSGYMWSLSNIPQRLAEYAVFPFVTQHLEVFASRRHLTDVHALICVALVLAAVASAGWRRLILFVFGFAAALGPVLILDVSADHYAYLAAAWVCAFVACIWTHIARSARLLLILPIAVAFVHGYQMTREIRHIGRVQRHLYADLPHVLAQTTETIRIQSQRNQEDFVLRRLLNDIPSYRNVPIGARVVVIPFSQSVSNPDFLMRGDGHLIPAR